MVFVCACLSWLAGGVVLVAGRWSFLLCACEFGEESFGVMVAISVPSAMVLVPKSSNGIFKNKEMKKIRLVFKSLTLFPSG